MTHMGCSIGIRELQQNASKAVRRAAAGEVLQITDRGRAVARLVPLAPSAREELVASGRLRPARRPGAELPALVEPPAGGPSASEVLADLRGDER